MQQADALRGGLQGLVERARGLPALAAAQTDLAAYGQAFEAFVEAVQAKELALDMASWSVSSVANNLDVLQAGLADDGVYTLKQSQGQQGGEFLEQAAQVAQVSRLMLQAMNEAHVRLNQSRRVDADDAEQGKIEQAGELADHDDHGEHRRDQGLEQCDDRYRARCECPHTHREEQIRHKHRANR